MTINPKTLDIKTLPWLPLEEKAAFPKKSAIYFAIDSQGTVQYIGRSANVRQRWGNHHKYDVLSEIGNVKIAYLFVDAVELLPKIEAALIEWFNPPLNFLAPTPNDIEEKPIPSLKINFPSRELKDKFKATCALNSRNMNEVIIEFVMKYIEQQEKNSAKKDKGVT